MGRIKGDPSSLDCSPDGDFQNLGSFFDACLVGIVVYWGVDTRHLKF